MTGTTDDVRKFCREHRVPFVRRDLYWPTRIADAIVRLITGRDRSRTAWTTVGATVCYPTDGPEKGFWWWLVESGAVAHSKLARDFDRYLDENRREVVHELLHVRWFERLWFLHLVLYLFFPVPVFLAWYRWRFERDAYLRHLVSYGKPSCDCFGTGTVGFPEVPCPSCSRGLTFELDLERAVDEIWERRRRCWPRRWMRKWFMKRLSELEKEVDDGPVREV